MKESKKGISLIVLVITIIVMIILAATVIISLTGNSVIDRANEAVDKTNEANVQQLASTLWAEAYLDGANTTEDFEDAITKGLEGYDTTAYKIIVTTKGVKVKLLSEMWIKKGFTVVRGDQVLEIGDVVNYDETAEGKKVVSVDTEWKVLGADEEGNLLLMSTTDIVSSHRLGYESSMTDSAVKLKESQNDWLNGAAELHRLCEPYGYGEGVIGKARSITIEDVDSVTGYDKTTYGTGSVSQYGNEVIISYNGTQFPAYTSVIASSTMRGTYTNGFNYYDGKEFKVINDLTEKTTGTITTLKNDYYKYIASELTTISAEENEKAYTMLFGNDDTYYWLASPYVYMAGSYISYGMFCLEESYMYPSSLWITQGNSYAKSYGVRAVVTLSSDIAFTGNSTDGWNY